MDTIKQVGYQSKQRELTDDELDIIIHRLIELMDTTDNPMIQRATPKVARAKLLKMSQSDMVDVVYSGDRFLGIVVYDTGSQWYSSFRVLIEILVLCVDKELAGFGRAAITILERRAEWAGAKYILSGNSAMNPKVTPMYTKKGFKSYPVFYKEVLNG